MEPMITNMVIAILLLMIWSALYKENPLYHFAESLIVGLGMGYTIYVTIDTLNKIWITPIQAGNWILIIPAVIGALLYSMFSRKYGYLSRIASAAIVGTGLGFATGRAMPVMILGQLKGFASPLAETSVMEVFSWAVVLVACTTTIAYFTFTREHKGALGSLARIGRWSILISFGAIFGGTIWANHVFVIERCSFLSEAPMVYLIPIAFAFILADILRRRKRSTVT